MTVLTSLMLRVPGLIDRPAVGTSCCVTSAEALIAQELFMLPGLDDAEIDPIGGLVHVRFDPDALTVEEITTALGEIGYPPTPTHRSI
jgi:hypothetical protein